MADPAPRTVGGLLLCCQAATPIRPRCEVPIPRHRRRSFSRVASLAEAIFDDYSRRRVGLLKALTEGEPACWLASSPSGMPCITNHACDAIEQSSRCCAAAARARPHPTQLSRARRSGRALRPLRPQQRQPLLVWWVRTPRAADLPAPLDASAPCTPPAVPAGEDDGSWSVDFPAEEVPPELPEPCLGELP
jgi:hypothetical protein